MTQLLKDLIAREIALDELSPADRVHREAGCGAQIDDVIRARIDAVRSLNLLQLEHRAGAGAFLASAPDVDISLVFL
jgi:hypothetical protein